MQACKPGSVSSRCRQDPYHLSGPPVVGSIGLPMALPRQRGNSEQLISRGGATYLTFQLVRFTMRLSLLLGRWALTPPFHYYLNSRQSRDSGLLIFCGTFCQSRVCAERPALSCGTMPDVARTFLPPIPKFRDGK